jgi:O-antigen/teichoic acid export membrane protein
VVGDGPGLDTRPSAGSGLRARTARGTIVNGAFLVGTNLLALVRGFLVAAFLTTSDFGVWGVLVVLVATAMWYRQAGIGEKFVQQDEPDQELAFRRAMTLELLLAAAFVAAGAAAVPLLAAAYGTPEVVLPGLAMLLLLPAAALQAPLWLFYRDMDFVRQRTLQAAEPVLGFVLTVGLAIAGLGYWALVIGSLAGAYAGAAVALRASPYRWRPAFDRATARSYASFSAPLLLSGGAGIVIGQALTLVGSRAVGLAGVGAIALAGTITQFAGRADQAITTTVYPAICAVAGRVDLLHETFLKSNRLALMWGVPFGAGLALFAGDLVHLGLGDEWQPAVVLLQATGIAAALHQIGFNWDAFYRALDRTRPIAVAAVAGVAAFLALPVPLLAAAGLTGLAWGILAAEVVNTAVRTHYLRRLFPGFSMARHLGRAIAPTLPAAAVVLAARATGSGGDSLPAALGLLALYVAVTAVATAALERELVREVIGYLRRRPRAVAVAA